MDGMKKRQKNRKREKNKNEKKNRIKQRPSTTVQR